MLGRSSDDDLIERAINGSESAWLSLVRRYEKRLYNHALRMVGSPDDAMDLMQDVFLSVYRNLGSYRGDAPFVNWMFRITTFRCTDHLRRNRHGMTEYEELPDPVTDRQPAQRFESTRTNGDIMRMMSSLPQEQRQVVELKFFQNFTFDEIAGHLGISSNTAKSRLYAALKKMRGDSEKNAVAV